MFGTTKRVRRRFQPALEMLSDLIAPSPWLPLPPASPPDLPEDSPGPDRDPNLPTPTDYSLDSNFDYVGPATDGTYDDMSEYEWWYDLPGPACEV
jgi:hypothetical protein